MNSAILQFFKLNRFAARACAQPRPNPAPLEEPVGPPPEPAPPEFTARFIKLVCAAVLLFVALLYSVYREIEHNRELYNMSQLVSASDAHAREWQERYRLEEARVAALQAELQSLTAPDQAIQITRAGYHLPN